VNCAGCAIPVHVQRLLLLLLSKSGFKQSWEAGAHFQNGFSVITQYDVNTGPAWQVIWRSFKWSDAFDSSADSFINLGVTATNYAGNFADYSQGIQMQSITTL